MNAILLATDGSPSAKAATHEAIELAGATHWPLYVLTVWRTPALSGYGYAPTTLLPELAEVEREHARDVAYAAVEAARAAGLEATPLVRQGEAAEEICNAAAELDLRVIVVGAHGWSLVKRLLFGSVSTHVLHGARCGVMVVRGGDEETAAIGVERSTSAAA